MSTLPVIALALVCVVVVNLESAEAQFVPHYCPKEYYVKVKRYRTRSVKCGCWGWGRCKRRFYYWETQRRVNYRACCEGWRSCYCHIPVCKGGCGDGMCVDKDQCYCFTGSGGKNCQYSRCNQANDCYPGTCRTSTTCQCPASYAGSNCQTVRDPPDMSSCGAILRDENKETFNERCGDKHYNNHTYYSNARDISEIEIDWRSRYDHYSKEGIAPFGNYILAARLGVVNSYADVNLYTNGNKTKNEFNKRITCGINDMNTNNPYINAECLRRTVDLDESISHNYRLEIDMYTTSGGYKDVVDRTGGVAKYSFNSGIAVFNMSVHIVFDLNAPIHCLELGTCEDFQYPVVITEDITKLNKLEITWTGWIDEDSDIDYYQYTVYRMAINQENLLEEIWGAPVVEKTTWDDTDVSAIPDGDEVDNFFPLFEPIEPGLYSVIIEVVDNAGNKGKARTLLLFDNVNVVEIIKDNPINIEGVSMNDAGLWIGTEQDSGDIAGRFNLTISWNGHFRNIFHYDNQLLNPCKPLYNTPGETDAAILARDRANNLIYDDNYGNLTTQMIPSSNGIVRFRVQVEVKNNVYQWLDTGIDETVSMMIGRSDKDQVKFTIEATDVLGNTMTDSVMAIVDSTIPILQGTPDFQKDNPGNQNSIIFGSQIEMRVYDEESGIRVIEFDIPQNGRKKRQIETMTQDPQTLESVTEPTQCDFDNTCYCTNSVCYKMPQYLYIDHCWLKALPERQDVTIAYRVLNNGGAMVSGEVDIGAPAELRGIGIYQQIEQHKLNVSKIQSRGAEVNWVYPFSCYDVEGVRVVIQNHDGVFIKELALRERVLGTLVEQLEPKTGYRVEAYVRYYNPNGGNVIESLPSGWVRFITGIPEDPNDPFFEKEGGKGLGEGAIVGIVFGTIIILLILAFVLFVVIRVVRHQPPVPKSVSHAGQNIRNRFSTMHGTARDVEAHRMKRNHAYGNPGYKGHNELEDDDMYVYGNMETDSNASWKISPDRVILTHSVPNAKGRFANLCVANLVDKNGKVEVVAKMLKEGYTEDEKLLMKAKMNFFATEDLQHENVVRFIGACPDEPILLFEYCDAGTLSEWLKSQTSISGDVEEQFSSFSMAIARGVVYLHSKKVVHKRLGARNILLKENMGRLNPKLYGFGPLRGESDDKGDEAGQDKKEKIPIKWMAPEQFEKSPGKPRVYSKATDVWGYGIVLWEIYSKGENPYPDMSSSQVKAWLGKKNRLAKPRYAPDFLYDEILLKTWKTKPKDRPAMQDIHANLRKHFEGVGDGDEYYYDENGSSGDGLAKAKGDGEYYYTKQKMNNTGHSGIYDDTY